MPEDNFYILEYVRKSESKNSQMQKEFCCDTPFQTCQTLLVSSRSVFFVLGSKSVYLINNKHFCSFPLPGYHLCQFFPIHAGKRKPDFHFHRAFYHLCIWRNPWFSCCSEGALRSLSLRIHFFIQSCRISSHFSMYGSQICRVTTFT